MCCICLRTLKPMGKLYYEINSSRCKLINSCITLFPMNVLKVSKRCVDGEVSQECHFCY